jgi:hypothetical protein
MARGTQHADDLMSMPLEEGLDRYDEAEDRALRKFAKTGLELRSTPPVMSNGRVYDGRVPINLPSLKPNEIGEYYGLQVAFTDYTAGQVVLARAEMLSSKEKLDMVLAAVRKSKVGTAQEKADLAALDVRYIEANANYIEAKTYFELLTTIAEGAARDAKFISRIIETKRMELDMGFRGGSVDRIPQDHPGADRFRRRGRERE